MNAIATDIEQRASTTLHPIANVPRVIVEIAEEPYHRAEFADASLAQQFVQSQPLCMAADHERLANLHTSPRAYRQQCLGFRNGQAYRFFAKHVLARCGRFDGPWHV